MTPEKYLAIRKKVETIQRELDRAKGSQDQLKKRLLDEFNCATIKSGKVLLAQLEQEIENGEQELEKAIELFQDKWGEKLS